jgi:hypothetical protein
MANQISPNRLGRSRRSNGHVMEMAHGNYWPDPGSSELADDRACRPSDPPGATTSPHSAPPPLVAVKGLLRHSLSALDGGHGIARPPQKKPAHAVPGGK